MTKKTNLIFNCTNKPTQLPPFWHDGEQTGNWQAFPLKFARHVQILGAVQFPPFWHGVEQIADKKQKNYSMEKNEASLLTHATIRSIPT